MHQLHNKHQLIINILVNEVISLDTGLSINSTHWLFVTDHSMKDNNVWMSELGHNGCLLEEFHFVHIFRASFQSFQGNLQLCLTFPCTFFNITKLARSKVASYSDLQVCVSIFISTVYVYYCSVLTEFGDEVCLSPHTTEAESKSHSHQRLVQSRHLSYHKCPLACSKVMHKLYMAKFGGHN